MATLANKYISTTYTMLLKLETGEVSSGLQVIEDGAGNDTALYLSNAGIKSSGTLEVDGTSQFDGAVTVGVNDTGHDVKFFGATAGDYMLWDESADQLKISGASVPLSVGRDENLSHYLQIYNGDHQNLFAGIIFSNTSATTQGSARDFACIRGKQTNSSGDADGQLEFLYNASGGSLTVGMYLKNDGKIGIGTSSPDTTLHVAGSFAAAGPSENFQTFSGSDTTPSVANGNLFKTHASGQTLTTFDDGVNGQIITVISTAAVVFAVSGNLQAGTTNITTASGDVTQWVYDGTNWYLLSWMDDSIDLSSGGF